MKTVLISACAAALLLTAGAASAQSSQGGQRIDADGDGRISHTEFLSRLDRMVVVDADRDGSVTPDERRAAGQARMAQRRDAVFARLDANSDGSISRDEFEARPQRAAAAPRAGMARQHVRRMAHRRAAVMADRTVDIAQVRERMSRTFARLDKDGDGYLTAEERRAGAMERRHHRRDMRRPSPAASGSE